MRRFKACGIHTLFSVSFLFALVVIFFFAETYLCKDTDENSQYPRIRMQTQCLLVSVPVSNQLPVEYMRGKPLCMELYPLLFSSCRIPGPKHDYIAHYGRSRRSPTHITVVRNYQVGRASRQQITDILPSLVLSFVFCSSSSCGIRGRQRSQSIFDLSSLKPG